MVGALGEWYDGIPKWEQRAVKGLLGERGFRIWGLGSGAVRGRDFSFTGLGVSVSDKS